MTKETGRFLLILLLFSISSWLSAKEGVVNQGLLNSPQNLQSNLILTEVPLGLIGVQDEVTLRWKPDSMGVLRFSPIPGGSDPTKYPFTINPADLSKSTNGVIQFLGNKLTTGIYYCIITSVNGTDHSTEFIIIREADVSPRIISPRSARGEPGINTNSPIFTWEEVNGVPFYHIILSDQPFTITKDEKGDPQTEGANIIWQAIVSGNSIAYGTPDPSGFFTITSPPPLVKGVRYNWLVLNNYGNNPALSSSVISNPSGFEIEVPPPFKAPENTEPARNAIVTSKLITFRWTEIEGASLYHIYLSRFEDLNGSTVLLPVWDGVTSNNLLDLSTAVLQQEGTYYWKILAQNESGNGAMGDTTSFFYSAKSATAKFIVRDLNNKNLRIPRATLTLESLTSGASPTVLPTGDNGTIERSLPLGSYKISASKEGYEDTTAVFTLSVENEMKDVYVDLRESPSAIYGSTIDANQNPLPFVTVEIMSQSSGEKKEVVSDINGKFSLGLSSDNWVISASKSGYKSAPDRIISLGPGVGLNLDEAVNGGPLMLAKNIFHLNGLVTTSSGEALWGAKIIVSQGNEKEETVSDAQGQYSVILGTGTWTVTVSKAGYVSPQPQEISIIDHNISLNLTLIPQANILSGTVTGAGVPLGDAEVMAIPNSGQTITVITNTFGQYTLSLGKGTYQIVAKKKGYISPAPTQFSLTVGQTISGVNFNLEAENSFIIGEVTSDGVTPLSGVAITNGTEIATTDLNGRYKLGVRFGKHTISASKEGYLSNEEKEVVISPGQTLAGIDFILTPNASIITGSIKNASLSVSNATVTAHNKTGVYKTSSDQKGHYSLSLTAGTYVIKAEKSGFVSTPDSIVVTVNPGQTVIDNNFSFVENLSYLSGIVKSASDPLRNTSVEVRALGAPHSYATLTGVDGKFNLAVLPGFRYLVTVKKTGYFGKTDTTNTLILSKTTHIIFELSPHQSLISGNILTVDGLPISNAKVKATNATSVFTTTSNAQGNYELGVDAGSYELTVQKSGFIPVNRQATVGLADTLSGENFTLTPNYASLDGFITNSLTGKAIERVLVVATESGGEGGGSVRTDVQGHYILQNLPLGVYKITVSHPSYSKEVLENKVFAGGSANHINIKLTPKDGQIAGKVTSNGSGISGVTITASSAGGSISAVTTNDGSYRIRNLTPSTYTVQASLTGYTSSPSRSLTVQANDTSQANFTVTPNEGKITGFVRENTAGMRGAKIIAIGQKGNTGSAVSGADGSYSILNLATDSYQLYVKLDRYNSSPDTASTVLLPGETDTVNFSLTRSVIQISGTVRDQGGNILSNIKVIGESPKGTQTTTTNANGQFQLIDLPTNTQYTVKTDIFEEGYQDGDSLLKAQETDISGVNLSVNIFRSIIRGNVGVANVSITAKHLQSQQIYTTLSQNDGSYFIKNLYDGDYNISVSKVGYKAEPAEKSVEKLAILEDRGGINFTMTEIKIAVSGMVKDPQGDPFPNVPVLVWSSSSASRIDTTGNDGVYSVTGLPPNLTYQVQTKLPDVDYENTSLTVEAKETNITNPDLTVAVHNSIIEGKISRTTGEVIEEATVSIIELNLQTNTDAQGNYRFAHLYPGTYTLKVKKAGFEEVTPDTIILSQGETKSHHVSSLTPLTAAISGIVSDKDGILANVFIDIIDESTKQIVRQDTTDNNGIYSVKNLQIDKKYTATASSKGYSNSTQGGINLSNGAVTVNLQLKPLANSFFGKVLRKSANLQTTKNGVSGALVKINGLAGGSWSDSTDAYGIFSITGLTSGTYSIVAEKGDSISSSQTITLVSGKSRKLRLVIEKTGNISGIVTYQGVGRPGVNVTAINSLAGTLSSAVTGTDGRYIIKGLLNGVYTVSSEIAGFSVSNSPQVATIASGSSEQINFVLTAENNSIIGTISDTESNLISGVSVKLSNATIKDSSVSDINGQFKFTDLSDGTYQIEAKLAGFKSPPAQAITLTGGQPAIVDIQLTAIKNSISGFVKDGSSGHPIKGAIVTANNKQGGVFSDTTGIDGSYLFELKNPGDYELQAQKVNYEESAVVKLNLPLGASLVQNLILTPIITTSTISGTILKKGGPVTGARVVCLSLSDVSVRDTVISDNSGNYLFRNLLVPGNYLLEVTKTGLPGLSSPVLELTENGINYNFLFPSAQLKWKISREGTMLLSGVSIAVNSNSRDIRLITDNNGEAETEENLTQGDFLVTINKDRNTIPPNRYSVNLPSDSATVLGDIYLPFVHHPTDSVSSQDSLKVTLLSWVVPEDTLWLHYKGIDALSFKKMALMKRVSAADTVKNDTMYYSAMLPPQKSAGKLTYFMTTRFRGHVYSNEGNPFETEVTNQGILSRVNLNFESKKVPVGAPVFLQVRAYDGINQPLTPQKVSWEITRGDGTFSRFSIDSTKTWFNSEVITTSHIEVRVTIGDVSLTANTIIKTEEKILSSLKIGSPVLETSNREPVLFTYAATDTNGVLISIFPIWNYSPQSSGTLIPSEDGQNALFQPDTNYFGQVQIFLRDSLSGKRVAFNAAPGINAGDRGLKVFQVIPENNSKLELNDGAGFTMVIPEDVVNPGINLKFKLSTPQVPDVKKFSGKFKVSGKIYDINVSGRFKENKAFVLKFPVPNAVKDKELQIGHWDTKSLSWTPMESTREGDHIIASTTHFSQFSVLQVSEALGIRNLKLLPNPFTPHDDQGLQISFNLTSNDTKKPFVTIKVHNMRGDLVKIIKENEPMDPIEYQPGAVNTPKWDGTTEDGKLARNGRYLVIIKVRDSGGEETEMKTVVLIK